MRSTRSAMLAASVLAMVGELGVAAQAMPAPRKGSSRDHKPPPDPKKKPDTALEREIAQWNAAVDARKQAKALANQRRR